VAILVVLGIGASLMATACSGSPQPKGDSNVGTAGAAATAGVAGTTTGTGGGNGACVLQYNGALVDASADPCCAWSDGPNKCDPGVSCNDKSGPNCCLIYATSATVGGRGCCLYAGGRTPRTGPGADRTGECASLLSGDAGITIGDAGIADGGDASLPPFDAGAPACGRFQELFQPSTFGFEPEPDQGTFNAAVSEVAADHLVLERATGESVTFRWAGPSLAGEFSVGESVSCWKTALDWHLVIGTRRSAEIHVGNSSTGIPTSGMIPGGVNWMLEPECANVAAPSCPGATSPDVYTYYRVIAFYPGDSIAIPMEQTATLGAWQITNVFHEQRRGDQSARCYVDFSNVGLLSALGPP
jgi:hypothetical protein